MNFFSAMEIAASGLGAQRTRMNVLASNLANARTTRTEDGQGPYRRMDPVFRAVPVAEGVELFDIAKIEAGLLTHPAAQGELERSMTRRVEGTEGKCGEAAIAARHKHARGLAICRDNHDREADDERGGCYRHRACSISCSSVSWRSTKAVRVAADCSGSSQKMELNCGSAT